jgi:phage shock protein C
VNQRLYRSRDDRIIGGVAGGVADYLNLDPSLVRIVWAILTIFSGGLLFVLYIIMLVIVPEEPFDWSAAGGSGGPPATPPPPPVIPGWTAPGRDSAVTTGAPIVAAAALAEDESGTAEGPEGAAPEAKAAEEAPPAQSAAWVAPSAAATPTDWRGQRRAERAARRRGDNFGAIIFGLILVLVGGFFLVEMYLPDIDSARFWPIVLVIVGVVLVIASFRPGSGNQQT